MIIQHKGKWMLKDGKTVRFFKTEEEAAKAAGLEAEWEFDHGSEKEEDDDKTPSHYDWLEDSKDQSKT